MTARLAAFDHLLAISDDAGTFEHAEGRTPRLEHGYCTDDMARVLIVVCREPDPDRDVALLGRTAFRFLTAAQGVTGAVRNRRAVGGRWRGRRGVEDCWGRSVWAFGTAANRAPESWMRESALSYFERSAALRSPWPRAMAFAALGAAEVLAVVPGHRGARDLLADVVTTIGSPGPDAGWPWPEPRLAYANAVLAEALIVAGDGLGRPHVLETGLTMLRWLLDRESSNGHLSPTPVGGAGPADATGGFDQQPIEVAAVADACTRAATVTGDGAWVRGVDLAVRWFAGENDIGQPMFDPTSGGGCDGLHDDRANRNEGAESTIALISTLQHARRLGTEPSEAVLPSRICGRCRQLFDGDPSLHPLALAEWWACPACRVALGIDQPKVAAR
ncbi:MAG TPA: hypothetical protein VM262_15070 [Acidimicrobiales bacterium]|nr:hypothetical protein [Acidimicrobiales bacterium]